MCVAYDINGERTTEFPRGVRLDEAKPVYEYVDGWKCDIGSCRKMEDLPVAARKYIDYLEKLVDCEISIVSVGAERDEYVTRK